MSTVERTNYVQGIVLELAPLIPDCTLELLGVYALLVLTRGTDTTLEDVHDAWAVWRNVTRPGHRSLIPFAELTDEVQAMDAPYRDAIVQVAARR